MNIKIATYSLIVAATCGLAFNSVARADEDENDGRPKPGNMRFVFEGQMIRGDHIGHRRYAAAPTPSSVHSGVAPKNLLGLDPSFVSKPAPLPVAPVAQPQVAAKIMPSNPFASVFGRPSTPAALVASAPQALPALQAPAAKFGAPNTPKPTQAPAVSATTNTHIAWKQPHHARPTALAAAPARTAPVAAYAPGVGYSAGDVHPGYGNGGTYVNTALNGAIIGRHHK